MRAVPRAVPTLVCPASRLLHRGDYELVVAKRTARGYRFICDHCRFKWTVSEAELRRLVFGVMSRPADDTSGPLPPGNG